MRWELGPWEGLMDKPERTEGQEGKSPGQGGLGRAGSAQRPPEQAPGRSPRASPSLWTSVLLPKEGRKEEAPL